MINFCAKYIINKFEEDGQVECEILELDYMADNYIESEEFTEYMPVHDYIKDNMQECPDSIYQIWVIGKIVYFTRSCGEVDCDHEIEGFSAREFTKEYEEMMQDEQDYMVDMGVAKNDLS